MQTALKHCIAVRWSLSDISYKEGQQIAWLGWHWLLLLHKHRESILLIQQSVWAQEWGGLRRIPSYMAREKSHSWFISSVQRLYCQLGCMSFQLCCQALYFLGTWESFHDWWIILRGITLATLNFSDAREGSLLNGSMSNSVSPRLCSNHPDLAGYLFFHRIGQASEAREDCLHFCSDLRFWGGGQIVSMRTDKGTNFQVEDFIRCKSQASRELLCNWSDLAGLAWEAKPPNIFGRIMIQMAQGDHTLGR